MCYCEMLQLSTSYMCTDTVEGKTSGMRASSMLCVAWSRQPLMCWRPPTAAARWRRSSIHRRARSNAPEMNFLCARAAVQRVAAADALCERHPTMTMECMYFAPHTRPARPQAHTHFAEASSESECALLRLMGPSGPSYPLRCRLWRRKPAGDL